MFRYVDVLKLAQDVACEPFVFRVGCVQCIRAIDPVARKPLTHQPTGALTNVDCDAPPGAHVWFVQACLLRPNTYGQDPTHVDWGFGGKILISPHMTKGEIVKKFLVAALGYSEHEVHEAFLYRERRIVGPHIDIDALWEVADSIEVRRETNPLIGGMSW